MDLMNQKTRKIVLTLEDHRPDDPIDSLRIKIDVVELIRTKDFVGERSMSSQYISPRDIARYVLLLRKKFHIPNQKEYVVSYLPTSMQESNVAFDLRFQHTPQELHDLKQIREVPEGSDTVMDKKVNKKKVAKN